MPLSVYCCYGDASFPSFPSPFVQELFPNYDSEEEREIRDLMDQESENWDMGSPDEPDFGTEGEGEEVVTEMMEESDPELSDLWPSDDVPLTPNSDAPRLKKRVSFAELEPHTQRRYGKVLY